jgi:hypothetical protein
MSEISDGEIICCSDTDIQFFKPRAILKAKFLMESTNIDYMGQKEHTSNRFNGGFFLIKKSKETTYMIRKINSSNLQDYKYAEQDLINENIRVLRIRAEFLDPKKYLHGCMVESPEYMKPVLLRRAVMHHATCAYNIEQKMSQMNFVRNAMGIPNINWEDHLGHELKNSNLDGRNYTIQKNK